MQFGRLVRKVGPRSGPTRSTDLSARFAGRRSEGGRNRWTAAAFALVFAIGVASTAGAQQAPAAEADSSLRLEASLQPVIAVDASGQARLDSEVGTANDRFTAEVEIAKADFADLGITRGNGFRDEVVELRVLRGGVLIFSNRLQFSRNLVNDITFETDIRGTAAPELRAGDVARLIVNGHFTLRGRFQVH